MTILEIIDSLTEKQNWSKYRLSKEADLPYSTITSWENKGATPTLYSLEHICSAFNISMSQLFEDYDSDLSEI